MGRLLLLLALALSFSSCGREETRPYRIGRDEIFYPADIADKQWQVLAFSDDLLRAISENQHFQIALYPAVWPRFWYLVRNEELDAVLSPIPNVPSNRKYYSFSDPYLCVGPVLVSRVGSPVNSLEDLEGLTVAVPGGTDWVLTVASVPEVVIDYYSFAPQALENLLSGEVDGVIIAAIPAYAMIRDYYQGKLHVVTEPLTNEGIRLLVKAGTDQELIEMFNKGLQAAIKDGTYDKLQRKWGLNLQEGPQRWESAKP